MHRNLYDTLFSLSISPPRSVCLVAFQVDFNVIVFSTYVFFSLLIVCQLALNRAYIFFVFYNSKKKLVNLFLFIVHISLPFNSYWCKTKWKAIQFYRPIVKLNLTEESSFIYFIKTNHDFIA